MNFLTTAVIILSLIVLLFLTPIIQEMTMPKIYAKIQNGPQKGGVYETITSIKKYSGPHESIQDSFYLYYFSFHRCIGDIVAQTLIGKAASVLLTVYSLIVIAIITGVVVNYYNQIIQIQEKDTIASFVDRLEHLSEQFLVSHFHLYFFPFL